MSCGQESVPQGMQNVPILAPTECRYFVAFEAADRRLLVLLHSI